MVVIVMVVKVYFMVKIPYFSSSCFLALFVHSR